MDYKSSSVYSRKKSRSPQSRNNTTTSNSSHQGCRSNHSLKKISSIAPKTSFAKESMADGQMKMEETCEKRLSHRSFRDLNRRNSTSNTYRKRFESEERDWVLSTRILKATSPSQSKYSWSDRTSWCSSGSVALTTYGKEKKPFVKNKVKRPRLRVDFAEDKESSTATPLLSLAVREQRNIIEMLHIAKEQLKRKIMNINEMKAKRLLFKTGTNMGDHESLTRIPPTKRKIWLWQRGSTFGDFYTNNLDEIFQVWIHLFCFIINLRINLIRIVNVAGTESFKPNSEVERGIVIRAIEGVKFFSFMKMKALTESIDEFMAHPKRTQAEIIEDENKISSPFLLEMEFIGKKAKEMLHQLKKENDKRATSG